VKYKKFTAMLKNHYRDHHLAEAFHAQLEEIGSSMPGNLPEFATGCKREAQDDSYCWGPRGH
jgi:hypothetical protein